MRILYTVALSLSFGVFVGMLVTIVLRQFRGAGKITRPEMVWTALPAAGLAGLAAWYF